MEYEPVIGLEVHVHLKTRTKAFCGCSTEYGNEPNTQACPVCLGFPGSLPVLNRTAFEYAIKVGLALNCKIEEFTKFDRKNYFYPDLPKNYQISQYDLPLAREGFVEIASAVKVKRIRVLRVHFEEDAGKLIHQEDISLVDFNRSGMPLLEIVSYPDIDSPLQAQEYLNTLKSLIRYTGVSDCDMEKGSLRCDANISLREKGARELGVKTEIKNMNSFKGVKDALSFEIERQAGLLKEGQAVIQETRLWDAQQGITVSMRSKEQAKDYRYFPEPDLPPFVVSREKIEEIRKTIPELPQEKLIRFKREYGLSDYDAGLLVSSREDAQYAEDCLRASDLSDKKAVANWLLGPMAALAGSGNLSISQLGIPPSRLAELINLVETQQISNLTGKSVLGQMLKTGKPASLIVEENNLRQVSDEQSLNKEIEEVLRENAGSAEDYKKGKSNAIMFLVGQVMKKTKGKANPKVVQDLLRRRLSDG